MAGGGGSGVGSGGGAAVEVEAEVGAVLTPKDFPLTRPLAFPLVGGIILEEKCDFIKYWPKHPRCDTTCKTC